MIGPQMCETYDLGFVNTKRPFFCSRDSGDGTVGSKLATSMNEENLFSISHSLDACFDDGLPQLT